MTTLDPEGLERAAEAIRLDAGCKFPSDHPESECLEHHEPRLFDEIWTVAPYYARAAVTAYLGHALPVVDGLPALWHLPDATILRDVEGVVWEVDSDDEAQWACVMGHEDGYPREDIALPARVIWWGDQ